MNRSYIDIHVLQTVPPSNVNRDDTGSPKTATYGGVTRARVSSQSWKRATRKEFKDILDKDMLGVRTTRLVELVAGRIVELEPSLAENAESWAEAAIKRAGIKLEKKTRKKAHDVTEEHLESQYLVFLSRLQIDSLARAIVDTAAMEPKPSVGVKEIDAKKLLDQQHSVDVALFGRMVADITDLSVDAAAQVAHAISVHGVDTEYDYFTAVDDEKERSEDEDAGAGMIGTIEFNSSTMYRYATVNLPKLLDNLGDVEATRKAVEAFVRAFVTSMPTGKQNTFANRTFPDAVVVRFRDDQPVNLVGAFEAPVTTKPGSGRVATACDRLAEHDACIGKAFGAHGDDSWVVGVGSAAEALTDMGIHVDFPELVTQVGECVDRRIGDNQ